MELLESWPLSDRTDLRDRLLAAYDDPARGYHDRLHLSEVLAHISQLRPELPRPEQEVALWPPPHLHALLLAAWFHDAVYDDGAELEERSAVLAEEELTAAGCRTPLVVEVARLVRLTGTHLPAPDDPVGAVLCDADLAILAADEERYADYVAGVRRDYAHVGEAAFRAGRAAVLLDLAGRRRLFHTGTGRRLWEDAARANLAREIEELTAGEATVDPPREPR